MVKLPTFPFSLNWDSSKGWYLSATMGQKYMMPLTEISLHAYNDLKSLKKMIIRHSPHCLGCDACYDLKISITSSALSPQRPANAIPFVVKM